MVHVELFFKQIKKAIPANAEMAFKAVNRNGFRVNF